MICVLGHVSKWPYNVQPQCDDLRAHTGKYLLAQSNDIITGYILVCWVNIMHTI